MRIIYYWAGHPTSDLHTIMRETNIASEHTITDWYNFLREVCQSWAERTQSRDKLGGFNVIVEIDESKFYRAKYNRGRMLGKDYGWVFGLIERGTNKVRLFPVEDRSSNTLLPIIAQNVKPRSIVVSDGWASYGGISTLSDRFKHSWVNHRIEFVNSNDPTVHTQSIEATWGAIKRSMHHLSGTSVELFPTYLFQYMFRRFHNNEKIFQHILEEIRIQYPV